MRKNCSSGSQLEIDLRFLFQFRIGNPKKNLENYEFSDIRHSEKNLESTLIIFAANGHFQARIAEPENSRN